MRQSLLKPLCRIFIYIGVFFIFLTPVKAQTNGPVNFTFPPNPVATINALEYFFDVDPGPGNATPVSISQGDNIEINHLVVGGLQSLSPGAHKIFFRSRNSHGAWSLTNSFLFFLIPPRNLISPENTEDITEAEYFFDGDPGLGQGYPITVTPGKDQELNNLAITGLDNLAPGMHTLFIRTRSASGHWSLTNSTLFFILPELQLIQPSASSLITGAEYFFNSEPGVGRGIPIPVSSGADINMENILISGLEDLPPGMNNLFVRTRNSFGNWSLTNSAAIFITSPKFLIHPSPEPADIEEIEYYINTDPGAGNARKVMVNGTPDINNLSFEADLDGLTPGEHTLFIRVKNARGDWSLMVAEKFIMHLPVPNDIQVLSLDLLDGNCALTPETEIRVRIFNGGDNTLSHFTISCEIDGIMLASEVVTRELLPGEEYLYHFSAKADLSEQKAYDIRIFTGLQNDDRPENDTIRKRIIHHAPINKGVSPAVTICAGQEVSLSAFGGKNYHWSTGSSSNMIKVSPQSTATYYVTITDIYGCKQTDSVIITVLPPLTAPVISIKGKEEACFSEAITLITDVGEKVQWYRLDNGEQIFIADSDTLAATIAGNYIARRINASGCQASSEAFSVNILPQIRLFADPVQAICKGSSVTITVENALEYAWSTGETTSSITVSPEETTTYYVNGQNTLGCSYSDSLIITVLPAIPPGAPANLIPSDQAINVDAPVDFSWSPATNASHYDFYLWKDGDSMPASPYYPNLQNIHFQTGTSFSQGTKYNWAVMARNTCFETLSPVQKFTTSSLPDLVINSFEVEDHSVGGNKLTVKYEVKNIGEGGTRDARWKDRIWLSADLDLRKADDILLGEFDNLSYLQPGESYLQTKEVTIPKSISGTYYLFIITDNDDAYCIAGKMENGECSGLRGKHSDKVKESNEQNNFVNSLITIGMAPLPDLYIQSIGVPTDAFSNDKITVQYQIGNMGERPARSELFSTSICKPLTGTGTYNILEYYWTDQVFISSEPDFNFDKSTRLSAHRVYAGKTDPNVCVAVSSSLEIDSSHNVSLDVTIPHEYSGTYYIYVLTNYAGVIEKDYLNNIRRSDPVTVRLTPPADLVVDSIEIPASVYSGEEASISFIVRNEGANPPIRSNWIDKIYLSEMPLFNKDSALLIGTRVFRGSSYSSLTHGERYTVSGDFRIPRDLTGNYYVFVHTDADNHVFEFDKENNNISRSSATMQIGFGPRADLIVKDIKLPDTITRGNSFPIKWTIQNIGTAATGFWADGIYVSSEKFFNSTAHLLLNSSQELFLAPGEQKEFSAMARGLHNLPDSLTFFVITDIDDKVYEIDETNNIFSHRQAGVPTPVIITLPPAPIVPQNYIDLKAVSIIANGSARSGKALSVSYEVENTTSYASGTSWQDRLYLSSDNTLDENDIFLATVSKKNISGKGTYKENRFIDLPHNVSGNYYLILLTDALSTAKDTIRQNNIVSFAFHIEPTPPADLEVSALTVPENLFARQSLMVHYTVKNNGPGIAEGPWFDGVYLSGNPRSEKSSRIGNVVRTRTLLAGESYTDSISVTIPSNLYGNYYLIVHSDDGGSVFENGLKGNNEIAQPISIAIPAPADLMVTLISVPDSAYLGEAVKASYEIKNIGANVTVGSFTDAVYLSSDQTYDPLKNTLLGTAARNSLLQPGESINLNIEEPLQAVFPANYYAIGRTNISNSVVESDLHNNTAASTGTMKVMIKNLIVNTPLNTPLGTHINLYYKIDTEADMDMVVDLTTNFSGSHNEFYIAYNRIPTQNDYDKKGGMPQQGNQRLIIPGTKQGSYYLMVVSDHSPQEQFVTLHARTLGFSLFSGTPGTLGQGPVSTRIEGAGFREGVRFALRKPGSSSDISIPVETDLKNSMEAELLWDLSNIDLGVYDLVAINQDNNEVILAGAVQVEKSTGYLLESYVSAPDIIRLGKSAYYNFTIINNGNVDIPFVETSIGMENYAKIVKLHTSGNVITRKDYRYNKGEAEMQHHFDLDGYKVILLHSRNVKAGEKFEVSVMYENFLYNVFPVTLTAEGFNREDFMGRQLNGIELMRNVAIYNPEFINDPELSSTAGDKEAFTDLLLNQMIEFGIIAPADTLGMRQCTSCGLPSGEDAAVVFSPGDSPGALVLPFADFGKGQRYKWEINNYEGFAGSWNGWDQIYTYGPINITATSQQPFTIELISLDFFNRPGYLGAFAPAFDRCLPIAIAEGGIHGFDVNKFVIDTSAFVQFNYTYGGVFSLKLHGTDTLMLCFTARKPGIGEPGIPGGPGGYGQDGARGGPGGDGDLNTPPGPGGRGGQGGYGDYNRPRGKGGKGGNGGNGSGNEQGADGPEGPEGPEGPDRPDSPNPPPPPKPDGTPDGTPPQVPPPGDLPPGVPPPAPPSGPPGNTPRFPDYPDLPGFPAPDRPDRPGNPPGRPNNPPGTPPAPACGTTPSSAMSSFLCKAAPYATGIQCGVKAYACYKLFISGGASLGLVFTPVGSVVGASAGALIAAFSCGWAAGNCAQGKAFSGNTLKRFFCRPVVGSCDPNEIQGPTGYGPERFVSHEEELPYRILYENDPDFATAPAQRVVITQPLDSGLDASSLELGNFGFSNLIFDVPAGLSNYTTRLKLADSLGFDVNVTAGLDVVKREIFWIFQSIDPLTGLSPEDPMSGYLPVNDSTGKGEGFVTYTIRPVATSQTGDTISAKAEIVFDINVPIVTNTAWNIIDAGRPSSVIGSETSIDYNAVINLKVEGSDDAGGSGLRDFVLYYSENAGPFIKYDSVFTEHSISFTGNPGSSYCFFTQAADQVELREPLKNTCELVVMLQPESPLSVAWMYFTGRLKGMDAELKWGTASESNTKYFVIERSVDAITFEEIGRETAQGNSQSPVTYTFVDKRISSVSGKVVYYRLKQADQDGKFVYSDVVALSLPDTGSDLVVSVYPNPFDKITTLLISGGTQAAGGDKVQLYTVSGVLLYEKNISGRGNNGAVLLNDLPKLASGMYIVKVFINGQMKTLKVSHL